MRQQENWNGQMDGQMDRRTDGRTEVMLVHRLDGGMASRLAWRKKNDVEFFPLNFHWAAMSWTHNATHETSVWAQWYSEAIEDNKKKIISLQTDTQTKYIIVSWCTSTHTHTQTQAQLQTRQATKWSQEGKKVIAAPKWNAIIDVRNVLIGISMIELFLMVYMEAQEGKQLAAHCACVHVCMCACGVVCTHLGEEKWKEKQKNNCGNMID